jgi:hypothetical protein
VAVDVLCCDLAIALTAAASARRSTVQIRIWSVAPSIAAVPTPPSGTAAAGQKRIKSRRSDRASRGLFSLAWTRA